MKDINKTKEQLIDELIAMRQLIAELKASEAKLKQAEERNRLLAAVMRDSNDAVTVQDFGGSISAWNRGAERMYGYNEAEAFKMNVRDIIPAAKSEEALTLTEKIRQGEKIESFETQRFTKDGRILDVWLTVTKLIDDAGKPIAFATTERDITERKQSEEELRKHRDHLDELVKERTKELRDTQDELMRSERLATLGQFSGSISHELRNPLGVIDSSVYYLKTKLKDTDSKVQEHLDRIKSSVGSATAIIESLLNLTRMEKPRLGRLNLIAITADAVANSKVPPEVSIINKFSEEEVTINADGEQLRIAFKNIIKNAVEAMDGKGTLTVTTHTTADGKTEISFADSGPGIAAENLEKVFQPLFSTKARGIGFGLSIAKMIINKHNGAIEARSELGRGANIIIQFPLFVDKDEEV